MEAVRGPDHDSDVGGMVLHRDAAASSTAGGGASIDAVPSVAVNVAAAAIRPDPLSGTRCVADASGMPSNEAPRRSVDAPWRPPVAVVESETEQATAAASTRKVDARSNDRATRFNGGAAARSGRAPRGKTNNIGGGAAAATKSTTSNAASIVTAESGRRDPPLRNGGDWIAEKSNARRARQYRSNPRSRGEAAVTVAVTDSAPTGCSGPDWVAEKTKSGRVRGRGQKAGSSASMATARCVASQHPSLMAVNEAVRGAGTAMAALHDGGKAASSTRSASSIASSNEPFRPGAVAVAGPGPEASFQDDDLVVDEEHEAIEELARVLDENDAGRINRGGRRQRGSSVLVGAVRQRALSAYAIVARKDRSTAAARANKLRRDQIMEAKPSLEEPVYDGMAITPTAPVGSDSGATEARERRKSQRTTVLIAIGALLTVITAAAVAAAVAIASKKSPLPSGVPAGPYSEEPSPSPTTSPSTAAPSYGRFMLIRSALLSRLDALGLPPSSSPAQALDDATSSQGRALAWLADKDDHRSNIFVSTEEETDDDALANSWVQRYALAQLYFATGGAESSWADDLGFLSAAHECEWNSPGTDEHKILGLGLVGRDFYTFSTVGVGCGVDSGAVEFVAIVNNNMAGTLPEELGLLSQLRQLYFIGNRQLVGTIPSIFFHMSPLERLYLVDNALSGALPEVPQNSAESTSLREFVLAGNGLDGTMPSSLGRLSGLTFLYFDGLQLMGSIPSELGQLIKLKVLELSKNQLTGPVPSELGWLRQLEGLNFGWNQLTGAVPSEMGLLTKLEVLWLCGGGNNLTGTMPSEIGELRAMTLLGFCGNRFSGTIPRSLGNLANLEMLSLGDNDFTGKMPKEVCHLRNETLSWLAADCGEVKCDCCTVCL